MRRGVLSRRSETFKNSSTDQGQLTMPATTFARYPSLKNKVVLITGGATGIGASFVEQFWAQGARVAFLDIDTVAANELVERLSEKDAAQAPLYVSCDVLNVDALHGAIE